MYLLCSCGFAVPGALFSVFSRQPGLCILSAFSLLSGRYARVIFIFNRILSLIMAMNSELVGLPLVLLTV